MQHHTDAAIAMNIEPFMHLIFARDQMLTSWLTPESICERRKSLIEEYGLATELSTASLVSLTNGINATFGQTRFPKKK